MIKWIKSYIPPSFSSKIIGENFLTFRFEAFFRFAILRVIVNSRRSSCRLSSLGGDFDQNTLFRLLLFPCGLTLGLKSFELVLRLSLALLSFNRYSLQRGSSPGMKPAAAFIASKWYNQSLKSCDGGSLEDSVIRV